jgi:hypothetical protein
MTTTTTGPVRVLGLDPATSDALRRRAADAALSVTVVEEPHAYPCRACLRDAEPGDRVVLVAHDPFRGSSPYAGSSPMYVHADPCPPPDDDGTLPAQLRRRLLSIRAYDEGHLLVDADVIPGEDADGTVARLLADPGVAYLHVHNARPGCWAARIDRAVPPA